MDTRGWTIVRGSVVLLVCLGMLGVAPAPVSADTCAWQGDTNVNWDNADNWSCGHVPSTGDDATIGPGIFYNPTLTSYPYADSVTIESGGHLTMDGAGLYLTGSGLDIELGGLLDVTGGGIIATFSGATVTNGGTLNVDPQLTVNGAGSVTNSIGGTMTLTGTEYSQTFINVHSPFSNNGVLTITNGLVALDEGGTHAGTFSGEDTATLVIGSTNDPGEISTFTDASSLRVRSVIFRCGTMNLNGEYWPGIIGTKLEIQNSCTTNKVVVDSAASFTFPREVRVLGANGGATAELVLEPYISTMQISQLDLSGILTNNSGLTIHEWLKWGGGTLRGSALTEVLASVPISLTAPSQARTLDGHSLTSRGDVAWDTDNLTLVNGATYRNYGTFRANATTTMSGGDSDRFINFGSLLKHTVATTTTVDVPTANYGSVQVIDGALLFTDVFEPGAESTITLGGGTFDAGKTLTVTEDVTVTGSGSLDSNLVNGGLVSPGDSPGLITVNGDYSQQISGTLAIELAGTLSGTEHDQLVITGTAALDGTLDVSFVESHVPEGGESYTIMSYADHTGVFSTTNLPALIAGLSWDLDYGSAAVTLSVTGAGEAPIITSADTAEFEIGVGDGFQVTTTGSPTPAITVTGALPSGLTFLDLGDGTAALSGIAAEGTAGAYPLTITAANGVPPDATQPFTLTVTAGGYKVYLPLVIR